MFGPAVIYGDCTKYYGIPGMLPYHPLVQAFCTASDPPLGPSQKLVTLFTWELLFADLSPGFMPLLTKVCADGWKRKKKQWKHMRIQFTECRCCQQ